MIVCPPGATRGSSERSFLLHSLPSRFEAHVLLELCQVGFEGRHFLQEVMSCALPVLSASGWRI